MTRIMILIAALNALNVHGSKKKCEALIDPIVNLAVSDALLGYPHNPPQLDNDIHAITKFKHECEKKPKGVKK
jgi:hypothetical protein